MAFRSSASTSSATGGTLTATPAGVVAHDYLGMFFVRDDTTAITIGYPTGWTEQVNADQVLPDKQTVRYADKPDASGSDSFALVTGAVNHCSLIEAAWSGRDNSTPRSTAPVKTNNTTANSSAISATITGITATVNDDIAVWMFTDQTLQASRWTFSTITSYTERNDGVALDWVSGIALDTRDAVSAGATGNFSTTITDASASTAGYGGIVVAIKAAASTATNDTAASIAARPGGSMGPRMRRAKPQQFADAPDAPTELTQTPAAPIKATGPRRRRSIPQQFADTPVPVVELTQSAAAPFKPGRGPGMGPQTRRRLPQRFPDEIAVVVVGITYPQLERYGFRGEFRGEHG